MGVLDKILDVMKLSGDDEDYDEDFIEEEEEEVVEEKPKRGFRRKEKYYNEEDIDFDEESMEKSAKGSRQTGSNNKVTPIRQTRKSTGMEVCVMKPNSVDTSRDVCDALLAGRTVILNLEGLDVEVAQRIIDFTSGATVAISGKLQMISNFIFLVTPTTVDISGDLQDLLTTSFDVPSIKTRYE